MNTEIFDLGKIGITLGGEYDNKVVYEKLTIVLYKGKSYISTKITHGVSPEQNILVWQLVAEAKDAYDMLVAEGKTTLTKEEFLEQLVDATKGRYVIQGNLVNAADEEDLTVEHSELLGIDTLKLANRPSTDGMGYIILRKNKSFAEQVTKENTIYEIRYDFTLGEDIIIPNNCVLKFNGGSISGINTITGTNTGIQAMLVKIFDTNITLDGTWNVSEAYPEWFGAKGDGVTYDTVAIQKTFDSFLVVALRIATYLTDALSMNKCRVLKGVDAAREYLSILKFNFIGENKVGIQLRKSNFPYVKINNVGFVGNEKKGIALNITNPDCQEENKGIPVRLYYCRFYKWETAIQSNNDSYYNLFESCVFQSCNCCLSNFNSNNLIIRDTCVNDFSYFLTINTGDGPTTIETSSFEGITGIQSIVYGLYNNNQGVINFLNNYVEIYSGRIVSGYVNRCVAQGNLYQIGGAVDYIYSCGNAKSLISIGNVIDIIDTPENPSSLIAYISGAGFDELIVQDTTKNSNIPSNYITNNLQISGTANTVQATDPINGNSWASNESGSIVAKDTSTGYWYADGPRVCAYTINNNVITIYGELKRRTDLVSDPLTLPMILSIVKPKIVPINRFTDHYLFAHDSDGGLFVLKWNLNTNDTEHYGEITLVSGNTTKNIIFDGCCVYI